MSLPCIECAALATAISILVSPPPAAAEWRRTSEVELNTAFTLEESSLSIGILSPLTVGVTESFQASIHPLLLLLGQPSLAFRLRLTPADDVTVALNVAGAWSFIAREDEDGETAASAAEGERVGFPGTVQLNSTVTFAAGSRWLFSLGLGPAVDFLGEAPIRGLVEMHASVHWLPAARHLVMVQALGFVDASHDGELMRPTAQLVYGWSPSARLHVLLGIGLGDWIWGTTERGRNAVRLFPLADLVFRF